MYRKNERNIDKTLIDFIHDFISRDHLRYCYRVFRFTSGSFILHNNRY